MKLITETTFDTTINFALNEATKQKEWFIEGIYFQANKPNRNKRIYTESTLDREYERYSEIVKAGRAIGELNHPSYIEPNPAKAVHRVVMLEKQGFDYYGKSVLNPKGVDGAVLVGLMEGGYKPGVSTRGAGSMKRSATMRGISEVQDDYFLSCVDVVHQPSGIDCWVDGIYEGAEWVWDKGALVEIAAEKAKKSIDEGQIIKAFQQYMQDIKGL